MSALLTTRQLSVSFGGVKALSDTDLDIEAGAVVGLIGPNGAGKTTFIDAVSGFVPSRGTVTLDGVPLHGKPAFKRARLGLGRTWQTADLYEELTVRENLAVACARVRGWAAVKELFSGRRQIPPSVDETAELLGLGGLVDCKPDQLSQGQRKLVDVARAVAARPRMLCLDEPAAGLDTAESAELGRRLRLVADSGVTLLLVDHDMGLVLGTCDHVVVLDFGKIIASGPPAVVRRDTNVLTAYLGESHDPEPGSPHDRPAAAPPPARHRVAS